MALTAEERDAQIDANEIVRQSEGVFRMLSMKEDIELAGAKREVAFLATISEQRAEIERLEKGWDDKIEDLEATIEQLRDALMGEGEMTE